MKVYKALAQLVAARQNCIERGNDECREKHEARIERIINEFPHGAGIDGETAIYYHRSRKDRVVIRSSFHCLNDNGLYTHWIDFQLIITPSLANDFDLRVLGIFGERQDLREYLRQLFYQALSKDTDK